MQKCLDDLEKNYAKCRVNRSEPVVPFRETLIEAPKVDQVGESFGEQEKNFMAKFDEKDENEETSENEPESSENEPREEIDVSESKIKLFSTNRQTKVVIQAFPLPNEVRLFLEESQSILAEINGKRMPELEINKFKSKLMKVFQKTNFPKPAQLVDSIIMLGKWLITYDDQR